METNAQDSIVTTLTISQFEKLVSILDTKFSENPETRDLLRVVCGQSKRIPAPADTILENFILSAITYAAYFLPDSQPVYDMSSLDSFASSGTS